MIIDKSKIALRKEFILGVLVEKWFCPGEVDWPSREYCSKTKIEYSKAILSFQLS